MSFFLIFLVLLIYIVYPVGMQKKRVLSGLKPTADFPHIGNYFGMIKPMLELGKDKQVEVFLFIPNMHALTTFYDGAAIRQNTINAVKIFLSLGATTDNFFIYNQSDIPAHAQLNWVLCCLTHMGFMERMHAYKDAISKGKANEISVGTFTYPILMAADILLYDAQLVPVGQDQKQHVEFARDIAEKFNAMFGETFVLPEPLIQKDVAVIPGIDGRKMSKSYNNYLGIGDDEKTLLKKVKQIVTDTKTVEEPKDPDSCNVYNILKLFLTETEKDNLRQRYVQGGLSYKEVKEMLYERLIAFVKPIQERYKQISDQEVIDLLAKNAQRANEIATKKITDVYRKVGFVL